MRLMICLTAAVALGACSRQAESPPATDNGAAEMNATAADTNAAAPAPAAFQLNETTWTFTDKDGNKGKESIDAAGKYIANSTAGKHLNPATIVCKGDKACVATA